MAVLMMTGALLSGVHVRVPFLETHKGAAVNILDSRAMSKMDMGLKMRSTLWPLLKALVKNPCPLGYLGLWGAFALIAHF